MTTPDVPLRLELTFEVPGTPEQVWDAIATGNGISSWFMRTDVEEREGGALCLSMGEMEAPATITNWEPPHRFAYVEEGWATFAGQPEDAPVTPLATEFLVEAQSGGTCVVQVVSSAFGTGADWEREFFADMEKYWKPYFYHLRLYLTHFPGQRVTLLEVGADLPGTTEAVLSAMRQALGAEEVGQPVEARGITGEVERVTDIELLVRLTDPVDGYLAFFVMDKGDGVTMAQLLGYLFSDDAARYVKSEQQAWKDWLQNLAVPAV